MTGLSVSQAEKALNDLINSGNPFTIGDVENIISKTSVADSIAPEGAVTHLYTKVNDTSFITDSTRSLNHTPAFHVLDGTVYRDAIESAFNYTYPGDAATQFTEMNNYLYGSNTNGTTGPWADISERFARETTGDVVCHVGDIDGAATRTWWNIEMPNILNSSGVTSVNGISKSELQSLYRELGSNPAALEDICRIVNSAGVSNTATNFLDSAIKYVDDSGRIVAIDTSAIGGVSKVIPDGARAISYADERRIAEILGKNMDTLSASDRRNILAALEAIGDTSANKLDDAGKLVSKYGDDLGSVLKTGGKLIAKGLIVGYGALLLSDTKELLAAALDYEEDDPYSSARVLTAMARGGADIAPLGLDMIINGYADVLNNGVETVSMYASRRDAQLAGLDVMMGYYNPVEVNADDLLFDTKELEQELLSIESTLLEFTELEDLFEGNYSGYNSLLIEIRGRRDEIKSILALNNAFDKAIENGLFDPENAAEKQQFLKDAVEKGIVAALDEFNERKDDTASIISPLVVDLNRDGFVAIGRADGAYFDLNNNGYAEKTAWIGGSDDGFLCLDVNGNGKIDGGLELFGNNTLLSNGRLAKDGFEALLDYDSDGDGKIDEKDEIFGQLRIWLDDGDGTSEDGELHSLADLGIKSISLTQRSPEIRDYEDSYVSGISDMEFEDGSKSTVADFWFEVSHSDLR